MAETEWGWVKHVVSTRGGVGNSMITANREGGEGALAGLSVEVELRSRWWQLLANCRGNSEDVLVARLCDCRWLIGSEPKSNPPNLRESLCIPVRFETMRPVSPDGSGSHTGR